MLHILTGRAGTGKSRALMARMTAPGTRRQILIVPEQFSHEAERRLCADGGDAISLRAEVLSFTRMANRVFSLHGGLAAPTLDAGGRILLMYNAVKEAAPALTVYARPSRKPAFLSGLLATLDECKRYRVTPEALHQTGLEVGGLAGDKLRDVGLLLGAYEALVARTAADPRDRLTRLAEALRETKWGQGIDLYIDGFTDFTPQELLVISALLRQVSSLTVALTCEGLDGGEDGGDTLFAAARRTGLTLRKLARENGVSVKEERFTERNPALPPELMHLERTLFDGLPEVWDAPCPAIELREGSTPWSEVAWAAARILELTREEGYRLREIGVAARRFEGYEELVDTVFARYGIPVFLTQTGNILEKPVLALVAAALETVAGGYLYDDVFRYLKTGLAGLTPTECDLLENYVLTWDVKGGRWTGRADWGMHPRGYGYPMTEADKAALAHLNDLRRRVTAPLETLRRNPDKTGRGQALSLYTFLEDIGLPERLMERTEALRERGQLKLAEEYTQLWDILCTALEQCAALLGDTPMELEEFSRLFTLVLSQYDVGTIPVSLDRVTAGDCARMGYRALKVLILLGADDDSIPQVAPSPGLFTDEDRAILAERGLELSPRMEDKLYRESAIVYAACAAPTERLLLSWAAAGSDGAERRPAFFLSRLRLLFPHLRLRREREETDTFRLAAPAPALELAGRNPRVRAALWTLPAYRDKILRMERALTLERGALSPDAVARLYGKRAPMSASRLDLYQSCRFSYFMRYGLKARARQAAGFQAPEYGTFIHYVLEYVLRRYGGTREKEALRALTRAGVEAYVAEELGGLQDQTPRFQYLFRRLLKTVYLIVENVTDELSRGDFTPIAFELGFGAKGDLPPVEVAAGDITLSISGFIDRVDGYVRDGRLYLRVVDYKTGRKSFDFTDLYNGMGLQMLLYLFALREKGQALFGREVVPAGVLYLPAREAVVAGSRSMTEEARRKKVDAQLRRRGLVLDDPEILSAMERPGEEGLRFLPLRLSAKSGEMTGEALVTAERLGKLGRHVDKVLTRVAETLAAGSIAADPYWRGADANACRWCDYAAACQFEEGRCGERRRYLPAVDSKDFWAALEQEDEGGVK